jgi:hypothetical protein
MNREGEDPMMLRTVTLAVVLVGSVGCGDDGLESTNQFLDFLTSEPKGGSTTLVRYEKGEKRVEGSGNITALTPGNIITVWTVIFNDAAKCSPPACSPEDVAPMAANNPEIIWVEHGVPAADGTLAFDFTIMEGAKMSVGSTLAPDFGVGLTSVTTSEIHFFVVDHGPPQPGREAGQRTNYRVGVLPNGMNCNLGPMGNWCPFLLYSPHFAVGAMAGPGGHGN